MDTNRWLNIVRARDAYLAASAETASRPVEAFFEVAARCNLRCQMCAINFDTRYRPHNERPPFLTPDLFERLRPIFPTLHRCYLFGLGEPVLNPHLIDYIRTLASYGTQVCFNTNATLIDEARAEAIASAGAMSVTVSIDGATAATYEQIRRGASFDNLIRGIRALVAARERFGRPSIDFSFVGMKSNLHELPALIDLAASLGACQIHVEPLFGQVGSPELDEHYERENLGTLDSAEVSRIFDRALQRAQDRNVRLASRFRTANRYDYVEEVRSAAGPTWTCCEPWSAIWVTSSGEVRTCCINDTSFGNLFQKSIDEIWHGPAFTRFREQHACREVATGCANCMRNGRMRSSAFFRPTQPVTYRRFFESFPPVTAADPVALQRPEPLSTSEHTIELTGTISRRREAPRFEVMIGFTPVASLGDAVFSGRHRFTMTLALPYLTEGAHVLWVRRAGEGLRGWGHRDIYFWRPENR